MAVCFPFFKKPQKPEAYGEEPKYQHSEQITNHTSNKQATHKKSVPICAICGKKTQQESASFLPLTHTC
jgi:hypothetical protein